MIRIKKGDGKPFINSPAALMAMQAAQIYYSLAGYLTTTRVDLKFKTITLTVHFSGKPYPTTPPNYNYSAKEITSSLYYSSVTKKVGRVRTVDFTYNY